MDFLNKWREQRDTRLLEEQEEVPATSSERPRGAQKVAPSKNRKIYAANYRNKHKDRINQQRRDKEQEPLGAYKKARRRAKYKGQHWDISFDNWFQVWNSCPKIFDDSMGLYRHAWQMRSGDIQKGTQMRRIDADRGWIATNVEIIYRNQPIPAHGIVALWDYKRDKPSIPEECLRP
jgi:hypothetical protein